MGTPGRDRCFGMKILMVSPFPPLRDGVGKYAAQEVEALRSEGHEVDVLAPVACAAHYVENFRSGIGLLKLFGYARRYQRIVLQYQPSHFHRRSRGPSRAITNLWMLIAFRWTRNLTVVCHEVDYYPHSWPKWLPDAALERLAWKGAREVAFHTDQEIAEMRSRLGVVPKRIVKRSHGQYYRAAVVEDRDEARRRLGVEPRTTLFLCIGFIQPHKGFDRAIRAHRRVPGETRLVVVGSIRHETPEHRNHLDELKDLAAGDHRVEIREAVVSDEEFDRWIIASDVVLLPYRQIWTSAVFERAHILGRPVIASRVGGLAEQAATEDVLVSDDEELAHVMARAVGAAPREAPDAMTVGEAMSFVHEESARRRGESRSMGVDRTLELLERSQGMRLAILPSMRRGIGPAIDLAKRVGRRGVGSLMYPWLEQVNEFEHRTIEAVEAIVSEMRRTDPSQYSAFDYQEFEKRFRGESYKVKSHQQDYVKEFVDHSPVLDVGCGRGEFLELLRAAGIDARGVDLSFEMVLSARNKNLVVEQGDGVAYLRDLHKATLGGVFTSQVVEHMSPRALVELLQAVRRAVLSGGVFVCETINPQSLYALANWYVMDLTHAQPIHPNTLSFLVEDAGFVDIEVRYLSPARPDREPITIGHDSPAWAQELARTIDQEIQMLSDVVFGPQDYALIARVP